MGHVTGVYKYGKESMGVIGEYSIPSDDFTNTLLQPSFI